MSKPCRPTFPGRCRRNKATSTIPQYARPRPGGDRGSHPVRHQPAVGRVGGGCKRSVPPERNLSFDGLAGAEPCLISPDPTAWQANLQSVPVSAKIPALFPRHWPGQGVILANELADTISHVVRFAGDSGDGIQTAGSAILPWPRHWAGHDLGHPAGFSGGDSRAGRHPLWRLGIPDSVRGATASPRRAMCRTCSSPSTRPHSR